MELPSNYESIFCPKCGGGIFFSISQNTEVATIRCDTCGHFETDGRGVNDHTPFETVFPNWIGEPKPMEIEDDIPEVPEETEIEDDIPEEVADDAE